MKSSVIINYFIINYGTELHTYLIIYSFIPSFIHSFIDVRFRRSPTD